VAVIYGPEEYRLTHLAWPAVPLMAHDGVGPWLRKAEDVLASLRRAYDQADTRLWVRYSAYGGAVSILGGRQLPEYGVAAELLGFARRVGEARWLADTLVRHDSLVTRDELAEWCKLQYLCLGVYERLLVPLNLAIEPIDDYDSTQLGWMPDCRSIDDANLRRALQLADSVWNEPPTKELRVLVGRLPWQTTTVSTPINAQLLRTLGERAWNRIRSFHGSWLSPPTTLRDFDDARRYLDGVMIWCAAQTHGSEPAAAVPTAGGASTVAATAPNNEQVAVVVTADKKTQAIAALLTIGPNVSKIARTIGVPRTTLLGWPEFRLRYDQVKADAAKRKGNIPRGYKSKGEIEAW
jgi:hypothetical protein